MDEINQNYYRLVFTAIPEEITLARLYEAGLEAIEEKEAHIEGYLPESRYSAALLEEISSILPVRTVERLEQQNWNAIWESSFQPVWIDGKVHIRASFHEKSPVGMDIVIDPKMAFGTGHHATTSMVIREMLGLDLKGSRVLDFGCGSGVLSVVAEKLGAGRIRALDYDVWSVENTKENIGVNQCLHIEVAQVDSLKEERGAYDLILANITRDVLTRNTQDISRLLKPGGHAIYSGFLTGDKPALEAEVRKQGMSPVKSVEDAGWCALVLAKS